MIRWVLAELWEDRLRMGLVALGVLWGTLGMASLLSFGGEMVRATSQTAANFGVDLMRVSGGTTSRSWAGLPAGRRVRIERSDLARVRAARGVRAVAWEEMRSRVLMRAGSRRHSGPLVGTEAAFADLRPRVVVPGGRFLSLRDEAERRRVAYLGAGAANALFGEENPVGQTFEALGVPFTVVGVGMKRIQISSYEGRDDDKVYIPVSALRDVSGRGYATMVVGLRSASMDAAAEASIRSTLGERCGFDPADEAALGVWNHVESQRRIGSILAGNRALTAVVAVLGFLVAVLGVANATWARVEERRREIGLSMALGARRFDVMVPPLLEAWVTAIIGGTIGLGIAAALFGLAAGLDVPLEVRAYLGSPVVSLSLGAAITVFLSAAGAAAGWWPAHRAASIQPIEVLRDE